MDRWNMTEKEPNGLKMVDLFCGAGVGACGFKLAGYDIVFGVDNKDYAVSTYNKNIGNHAVLADIRKLEAVDVPDHDVMVATPVCKSFSFAGNGKGEKDERYGDLSYHFYRLLKEKMPKAFIFENVGGMVSKKHIGFFEDFVQLLKDTGYNITWELIDCHDHGVPQKRKRVFMVGIRSDLSKVFEFPQGVPEDQRTNIRYAIGDLPDPHPFYGHNHVGYGIRNDEAPFVDKIPAGGNWKDLPEEDQKAFLGKAFSSGGGRTGFLRKVKFENPAHTITSCMNGKNNAQILDNKDKYFGIKNQENYCKDGFSSRYTSRNRQRQWDEPSFTIVSSAKQLPLYPHPSNYDIRLMDETKCPPPRRFTVRECLRLQTVPDWFYFDDSISLAKQYERCSGIPSLMAYKIGIQLEKILKEC